VHFLGMPATPYEPTRTRAGLDAALGGAASANATTAVELQSDATVTDEPIATLDAADAIVFASPTFRAGVSWPLKALTDQLPRGGAVARNRGRVPRLV
jgi:multimeric flavodoxin WrbA